MQSLSLVIPITCYQPLRLAHRQPEHHCQVWVGWELVTFWCSVDRCWFALNQSMCPAGPGCMRAFGCWVGEDSVLKTKMFPGDLRPPTFLKVLSWQFYSSCLCKLIFKVSFTSCLLVCLLPLLLLLVYSHTISLFACTHLMWLQLSSPQLKCWRQLLKSWQRRMQHQVLWWDLQLGTILNPSDIPQVESWCSWKWKAWRWKSHPEVLANWSKLV